MNNEFIKLKNYKNFFINESHPEGWNEDPGEDAWKDTHWHGSHRPTPYGSSSSREFNRRRYPSRPFTRMPLTKLVFYNVPKDKEDAARNAGLKITKSGKWYSPNVPNTEAEKVFGKGREWTPKN